MNTKTNSYLLLFFILISVGNLSAQESLTNGIKKSSIHSKILDQEREILIFSTEGEPDRQNDFPTLYLLDGKENFLLVSGLISNLVRAELLPNLNLVGINNYDYDREYDLSTPANSEDIYFETGGASDFQRFMIEELFPYISASKTSSDYKVLIGHSFGGSFGLNMINEHPKSFSSAILVDPSIWWNDAELIETLKKDQTGFSEMNIYLSRSGNEQENIDLFDKLCALIESDQTMFEKFPEENHISTLAPSIFHGAKYVFREYAMLEVLYAEQNFADIKEKIEELSILYNTTIPPKVRAIAPMARNLTNEGKYSESIEILSYLRTYHPDDIMVLNFLGEAYEKSGDLENARLTYNRSLEIAKSKNSPMVRWIEKRLAEIED